MDKVKTQVEFDALLNHRLLKDIGPEVKSYIYQSILEFEPFTTPECVVSIVAKDPLKLMNQSDTDSNEKLDAKKLNKMYRIAIIITEEGTKVEAEALHESIYEAIRLAKENLLAHLREIQDSVVSAQDRQVQIQTALASGQVH